MPCHGFTCHGHVASSSCNLRESVRTHVTLTPGVVIVGCEPQFVLHFWQISESAATGAPFRNRVLDDPYRTSAFRRLQNVQNGMGI